MFALTKKTGYALIALSYLAERSSEIVSARRIAEDCGIPQALLTNILKELARTEIVKSERGSYGGYALARAPEDITLYELISTTEGEWRFVRCLLSDDGTRKEPCELELSCPVRTPANRIQERFKRFLEEVTLAELVPDNGGADRAKCRDGEDTHNERIATRESLA